MQQRGAGGTRTHKSQPQYMGWFQLNSLASNICGHLNGREIEPLYNLKSSEHVVSASCSAWCACAIFPCLIWGNVVQNKNVTRTHPSSLSFFFILLIQVFHRTLHQRTLALSPSPLCFAQAANPCWARDYDIHAPAMQVTHKHKHIPLSSATLFVQVHNTPQQPKDHFQSQGE